MTTESLYRLITSKMLNNSYLSREIDNYSIINYKWLYENKCVSRELLYAVKLRLEYYIYEIDRYFDGHMILEELLERVPIVHKKFYPRYYKRRTKTVEDRMALVVLEVKQLLLDTINEGEEEKEYKGLSTKGRKRKKKIKEVF